MVEKYLNPGERVVFSTGNEIRVGEEDGFRAFVTSQRLIFLKRTGLVFRKDSMIDTLLRNISGVNLQERGFLRKKKELELRGPGVSFRLFGKHGDLSGLHSAINGQLVLGQS